jgi:hypothetical protein
VGIGIDVGKQLINCLLFADDIALIAETEEELQRLLDVASAFVIKWNLSFNFNKSKVLVVRYVHPSIHNKLSHLVLYTFQRFNMTDRGWKPNRASMGHRRS